MCVGRWTNVRERREIALSWYWYRFQNTKEIGKSYRYRYKQTINLTMVEWYKLKCIVHKKTKTSSLLNKKTNRRLTSHTPTHTPTNSTHSRHTQTTHTLRPTHTLFVFTDSSFTFNATPRSFHFENLFQNSQRDTEPLKIFSIILHPTAPSFCLNTNNNEQ